jgi:hypothetical protein
MAFEVGVPRKTLPDTLEPTPARVGLKLPEGGVVCVTFIVEKMLLVALDENVVAVAVGVGPATAETETKGGCST